ncbi:hypothetical protein ACVWW6_000645 [Bradyrhizobium sp. USDA 3311]
MAIPSIPSIPSSGSLSVCCKTAHTVYVVPVGVRSLAFEAKGMTQAATIAGSGLCRCWTDSACNGCRRQAQAIRRAPRPPRKRQLIAMSSPNSRTRLENSWCRISDSLRSPLCEKDILRCPMGRRSQSVRPQRVGQCAGMNSVFGRQPQARCHRHNGGMWSSEIAGNLARRQSSIDHASQLMLFYCGPRTFI